MAFVLRAVVVMMLVLVGVGCVGSAGMAPDHSGHAVGWRPEKATGPYEAMIWRRLRWRDENGSIAADGLRRARAQRDENIAFWTSQGVTAGIDPTAWEARGPENVAGRTRSLLIDPENADHMWAGSVGGGLWESDDGGATWDVVDDFMPNLAIGCLAMDPSNSAVMYAGTGEGFFNGDALNGAGIYRTDDGGATWNILPSTSDWDTVNRIAVSPADSDVILAGRRYGGVFRSDDGGATWSDVFPAQGSFFVAFDPTDATRAIAHVIDYSGGWLHRALYSLDGGVTWSLADGGAGLGEMTGFTARIELAYAPSDPSIVYASVAVDGGKIWRSEDGGQTYVQRTGGDTSGVNWYANPLWVDPTNPDVLVTGGYHLYRSFDGGINLGQISNGYIMTNQPHPDQHQVVTHPAFDGGPNRKVYVTNDGGVWECFDIYTAGAGSGWQRRDATYETTQFYGVAGDGPTGLIIGGTQDNGTLRLQTGSNTADLTFGGDGGYCAIDPDDPSYCYGEYVYLRIFRSTNGGGSGSYIYDGIGDAGSDANFIAPFILDPNDSNTMLAGGASLWRSDNVKAGSPDWEAIRAAGNSNISSIAVAPGNSNIIWVGQNNGVVEKTTNGTAATPTWSVVDDNGGSDPLPDRFITDIDIDPDDSDIVYVTTGSFSTDNLWRTDDGGATWSDITGTLPAGLPEVPIYAMTLHPVVTDWLYVGTEVGVFASADGGATWSASNEGPANASVDDLLFMHDSTTLLAATHGRGIFTAEVDAGDPFRRGDLDGNGVRELPDVFAGLNALFLGGAMPTCADAADVNDDGSFQLADMLFLLDAIFLVGSPAPPPPNATCGNDPTSDALDCVSFSGCP